MVQHEPKTPSRYGKEPFTDAGIKFVERDEHFWWAGEIDEGKEVNHGSPLKDDETVVDEQVTEVKVTHPKKFDLSMVETVARLPRTVPAEGVRGELFEWTPGGDCIA